ncbi:hypothetical protein C8J57DRAFT_1379719, partial [Mycena rebaudengoi]
GTARASERDGRAAGGTESQWWEAAPTDGVAPVGDAAAIPGDRKCAFGETCGLLSGRRSERVRVVFVCLLPFLLLSITPGSLCLHSQTLALPCVASPAETSNAKTCYVVETLLIPNQHGTSDACRCLLLGEGRLRGLRWVGSSVRRRLAHACSSSATGRDGIEEGGGDGAWFGQSSGADRACTCPLRGSAYFSLARTSTWTWTCWLNEYAQRRRTCMV